MNQHNTSVEAIKVITAPHFGAELDIQSRIVVDIGAPGEAVLRTDGAPNGYPTIDIAFARNVIQSTTSRLMAWECRLIEGHPHLA